jgi:hypothetical protein
MLSEIGTGVVQIVLSGCLFGVVCAMGLWMSASVQATVGEIVRRGGSPFPPGEP